MKKLFIVSSWKSNKTIPQTEEWFRTFNSSQLTFNKDEKEIIVCPPFTLLPLAKELIVKGQLPIALGSQDVSPFDEGAYTGEVNAKQVKEFADYAIIGHSERRNNFNEGDALLEKKVEMAGKFGITPIFCVQGVDTSVPKGVSIVAYEPVFAIGTGNPDTPENAEDVAKTIKEKSGVQFVLYGGSVAPDNVKDFLQKPSIDGVLVGTASLDAGKFGQIIDNS